MQFLTDVREKAAQLMADNATTLLTTGGVVGTVATAVLSARAAFQASEKLHCEQIMVLSETTNLTDPDTDKSLVELTPKTKLKLTAPYFIPPVITGTATVAAIIMSHRMSSAKIAGLAAAYGLAERNFGEYKDKVAQKLTGPKQAQIDEELAQERVNRASGHDQIVVVEGDVLCFDEPTGRYFTSSMQKIQQAVNKTNAEIMNQGYASMEYFYQLLGLPPTTISGEIGWNAGTLCELTYSTVLSPDDKPCIAIDFKYLPTAEYAPKYQ